MSVQTDLRGCFLIKTTGRIAAGLLFALENDALFKTPALVSLSEA